MGTGNQAEDGNHIIAVDTNQCPSPLGTRIGRSSHSPIGRPHRRTRPSSASSLSRHRCPHPPTNPHLRKSSSYSYNSSAKQHGAIQDLPRPTPAPILSTSAALGNGTENSKSTQRGTYTQTRLDTLDSPSQGNALVGRERVDVSNGDRAFSKSTSNGDRAFSKSTSSRAPLSPSVRGGGGGVRSDHVHPSTKKRTGRGVSSDVRIVNARSQDGEESHVRGRLNGSDPPCRQTQKAERDAESAHSTVGRPSTQPERLAVAFWWARAKCAHGRRGDRSCPQVHVTIRDRSIRSAPS